MQTPSAAASRPGRRIDPILLLVLVFSIAIKLTLALNVDDVPLRKDERAYVNLANNLITTGRYTSLFRPPAYPVFIAAVLESGGGIEAVRVVQVVLSTLTVLFVYLVASRHLGRRTARWAAGIVAFDPVLVAFSHFFWTETLFLFFLWAMCVALLAPFRLDRGRSWLVAGLCFGAAGLTRPVILGAAPWIVAWLLWRTLQARRSAPGLDDWPRRFAPALRAAALLAAGAFAVVLPWTARNYRELGAVILVDTNGAVAIAYGVYGAPETFFIDRQGTIVEKIAGPVNPRLLDRLLMPLL